MVQRNNSTLVCSLLDTMLSANGVYALTGVGRHTDKHLEPII